MKHLLLTFFLICSLQGFGQIIISHESGIVSVGTSITISSTNPSDTLLYSWGAYPPTPNSMYVVGSGAIAVPEIDSIPEVSLERTTVDLISELKPGMNTNNAVTDSVFQLLPWVEKKNVLWVREKNCLNDTCFTIRHYSSAPNDGGYKIDITALPEQLFGDSGIMVEGVGNLINPHIIGLDLNQDNTFNFTYNSSAQNVPLGTVVVDSTALISAVSGVYNFSSTVVTFYLQDTTSGSVDYIIVDTNDSTLKVGIPLQLDTLVFSLSEIQLNSDSSTYEITFSNPTEIKPNFSVLDFFNWLDLYPEIDRGIVWKRAYVTITHHNAMVYDGWTEVRVTGNWSAYHPKKSFRIKFLGQKWEYVDFSERKLRSVNMRAFGTSKTSFFQSDMFANGLLYADSLSVPSGEIAEYYINGEYFGIGNLCEHMGDNFISDRLDVQKEDIEMSYRVDHNQSIVPLDVHRDSVAPRQLEYMEFFDWLKNTNKNSQYFIDSLSGQFHHHSFFKSLISSAFLHRTDNSSHNARTARLPDVGYREFIKDYDGICDCFNLDSNMFQTQLHDSILVKSYMNYKIFNELIQSDTLRWDYYNTLADMLSTTFLPSNTVAVLDSTCAKARPYVQKNHERYQHLLPATIEGDSLSFEQHCDCARVFLQQRPTYVLGFADNLYGLDTALVTLRVVGSEYGQKLYMSDVSTSDSMGFERISFANVPTQIRATDFGLEYIVVDSSGILDTIFENNFYMEFDSNSTYTITAYYDIQLDININALQISEAQPDNESGIVDEEGKNEDWFELVNNSNSSVNLKGLFLSDKLNNLQKYQITIDTLLASGEYMIFWADEDMSDGFPHINFKLNKDGEAIYLSDGFTIIDSLVWNMTIPEDSSFGLCEAGPQIMSPTPGDSNLCLPNIILDINFLSFMVTQSGQCLALNWLLSETPESPTTILVSNDGIEWEVLEIVTGTQYLHCGIDMDTEYYYQLVHEGDTSDMRSGKITTTGLSDISITPNPNNGIFTIPVGYVCKVYNFLGQLMYSADTGEHNLPRGIYIIVFVNSATQQIVSKQKLIIL